MAKEDDNKDGITGRSSSKSGKEVPSGMVKLPNGQLVYAHVAEAIKAQEQE